MNQIPLDELLRSLKERSVRMPADIGTFIALEATEGIVDAPKALNLSRVVVTEEGEVGVSDEGVCDADQAAQAVTSMLGALLVAAGTGVPAAMVRLVEAPPPTGEQAVEALRDQLEAALVPLNRGAARRVLGRLIRESRKPIAAGGEGSNDALDDAVDALVGGEKLPPSPRLDPMLAKVAEEHAAESNESPDTLSDDVQPKRAPREVDLGPTKKGGMPWALILFIVLVAGATVWFMQNRERFFGVPSSATPSSATP
jgi:hypothetical protein